MNSRRPAATAGVRRRGAAVLVAAIAGGWAATVLVVGPASAATSDLITTDSTVELAWADQNPRNPADGPTAETPGVYPAYKDIKLRVSQTKDLFNQVVQVSWTGAVVGGSMQLMQCWSDSPAVQPTREQCAWGATADGGPPYAGRAAAGDPREAAYVSAGSTFPLIGAARESKASWSSADQVSWNLSVRQCPVGTTGYDVVMVPPVDNDPSTPVLPGRLTVTPRQAGPPADFSFAQDPTTTVHVTVGATLDSVAAANGITDWPVGAYSFETRCLGAGDAVLATFTGRLQRYTSDTGLLWRAGSFSGLFIPFDPLGTGEEDGPTDKYDPFGQLAYLKPRTTNEVLNSAVRLDGGGSVFFEVQTDLEAPELGCGRVEAGGPRSCWLVAVPRGGGEDSLVLGGDSPLAQTRWDARMTVPLAFAPVASGCTIGSGLKQVLARDAAALALRSWQPKFCGTDAAASVVGPLPDSDIRDEVSAPNRMGVVGVPDAGPKTVVAAPLTTSALVVAFVIDRHPAIASQYEALDGTRVTELRLNQRLLAKLLTQSYDSGASPNGGKTEAGYNGPQAFPGGTTPARNFPAGNPRTLMSDPEFTALNPDSVSWFDPANLPTTVLADLLVTVNTTDDYNNLWRYITADAKAAAFVRGEPDEFGMVINPYYKDQVNADLEGFPLLDPTCGDQLTDPTLDWFPALCQLNLHPRVASDTEAARSAVRGDTRKTGDLPILINRRDTAANTYKATGRQAQGRQAMLAITTSAVAARFGLATAALPDADGTPVTADQQAMVAARDQMTVRSDGVLVPQPDRVRGGGYPLTSMSYAVVDVASTTQAQNNAFATILDYAAGAGQVIGQAVGTLPVGYAPLSPQLAEQTRQAATLLREPSSLLPTASPTTATAAATTARATTAAAGTTPAVGTTPARPRSTASATTAAIAPLPAPTVPTATATDDLSGDPLAVSSKRASLGTPLTDSPLRWVIPVVVLAGVAAAVGGPLTVYLGRRFGPGSSPP